MIHLPFPIPRANEARQCASPSYWRHVAKRVRKQRVRELLRKLGVPTPRGTGGGT